tara:strand:- start:8160 stop:9194 length:1035 start_codon:yes stop_codon:yes gene_type:complete
VKKVAFITGVTGQDGSYLAEFLLEKGYEVHGMVRRSSLEQKLRIDHLYKGMDNIDLDFHVHYGDMTDSSNIMRLLQQIQPDEVYNLAAQSHVRVSFDIPEYTANADAVGSLRILEAIRILGLENKTKYYQASTSELYGKVQEVPQKETTPFYPRSPYAVAKIYSYWLTINYREAYNIFACNGILFNHESPRRGNSFVTKKITESIAKIKTGELKKIRLGNIDAKRDWGYAPDYVEAMWLMLQHDKPIDFVIATGETHAVREFLEIAFKYIDIDIEWKGEGVDEKGFNSKTNEELVSIDPYYFRPTEVDLLIGDPSLAKEILNWEAKVKFKELVDIMMKHELSKL